MVLSALFILALFRSFQVGQDAIAGHFLDVSVHLSELQEFFFQQSRLQTLELGHLLENLGQLGCLAFLHEHVRVADGCSSVQQATNDGLNRQEEINCNPRDEPLLAAKN
jgi:hypothetical protein